MGLRLYNTATRSLEPFQPLDPERVGIYACGPTVYGHAHIGNFRTFVFYDLVHRTLEWLGYPVHFVMNLTDVDDKTIAAAAREGMTLEEYTAPFAESIMEEADTLGIRRFDLYPRATSYVDRMIELVSILLERGLAYSTDDGSVYFDISAFPDYGKLSGKDLEQGRRGERVAADEYEKEDARDFALWKASKEGDEAVGAVWEAPWGRGRPGWHLECSAMGLAEVGETLDLHLGGEDLIFPHHEDEIAQSEGATGKPFVRTWLHVKHLRVEGEKMSKSLGNVISVRGLIDEGVPPAAIRHQLLSAHYRSELNFTRAGLEGSARAVSRLLDFEARLEEAVEEASGDSKDEDASTETLRAIADRAEASFREALADDLNAAEALAALFVFMREANSVVDEASASGLLRALEALRSMDEVLGLLETGRAGRVVDPEFARWVESRIREREDARSERDWQRADAIREELGAEGVILEDSAQGTRWKRGTPSELPG
ncbi:MAG: cysteine--tRNA ligase [Gemmatimonadales bacterium]|nr:MAG: cysteine--tRNA ligase [Gemmatimonadales bacterium]